MTATKNIELPANWLRNNLHYWRTETAQTLKLAIPMALTQLGQIAMLTTDLMLLGQLGGEAVAAVALAHTVFFTAFVLGLGLVSAVGPLSAQSFGARKPRMVRRSLRVGLWAAVLAGIPITIGLQWGETILIALGQQPETAAKSGIYLLGLAYSLIPAWAFIALRSFMASVNRPEPALWITLAAIPANALLAYALIFGAFGLPRLEMLGAGIATALVNLGMCAAAIWIAYALRPFKKYRILGRFWRFDPLLFRRLLIIGLPISGVFALEFGAFAAAALFMGKISTAAIAAHQIALQVASILFMVPFGISMAATVRVGQALGRKDDDAARGAGFAAIGLGVAFMLFMMLVIALTRHSIPALFIGEGTPLSGETVMLAASLLLIGICFFVADGTQTVTAGALRGMNDTRIPMVFALVSFWIVGVPSSYVLAFHGGHGAAGVWIGLSIGLAVYAILLVLRFEMLTRGVMASRLT